MARGHHVGGPETGPRDRPVQPQPLTARPGSLSLTPPLPAGIWRAFPLFPDRDLLGQSYHFLDRKEKAPRGWGHGG